MDNFDEYIKIQRRILEIEKERLMMRINAAREILKSQNENKIQLKPYVRENSEILDHGDDLKIFAKQDNFNKPKSSIANGVGTCFTEDNLEYNDNIETQGINTVEFQNNDRSGMRNNWKTNKDDMEQWISDTFYSYFPSFNLEYKKERENNIRSRQLDYQNYLKKNNNVDEIKNKNINEKNLLSPPSRSIDRSERGIIVTGNPNYENQSKHRLENAQNISPRPSSTREKLLHDLRHTELSNLIYGDGLLKRRQAEVEEEMRKKKEYQMDLMRQIEEKRREIQLLKEKERLDDENLTRKLEEQLKTMKLQEELEKEKIKTERTRFQIEKNKIIRNKLISKLESDQDELKSISDSHSSHEIKSESDKINFEETNKKEKDKNDVYRFFTNSAHRKYNRTHHQSLTDAFEEFAIATNTVENHELVKSKTHLDREKSVSVPTHINNCPHLNINECPFCHIKLKNYESWCPKCNEQILDYGAENKKMLCENCENQYLICSACDRTKVYCDFCHQKRNICSECIRNFCIHCGKSIRRKKTKIPKLNKTSKIPRKDSLSSSPENSFQILELPNFDNKNSPPSEIQSNNHYSYLLDSTDKNLKKKNFSTNYDKKSIFNVDNKPNSDPSYFEFGIRNGEVVIKNKIFNNFKNENPVTGTQNSIQNNLNNRTANDRKHRISLNEMPLLKEMPKKSNLKKKISPKTFSAESNENSKSSYDDLLQEWEIPAVEKRTITNRSPIVLTQLGAVRRQLQIDRLQEELL